MEKELFYKALPTFATFGKGWMRRVAEAQSHAVTMLA
jgi:lysozyme family protein